MLTGCSSGQWTLAVQIDLPGGGCIAYLVRTIPETGSGIVFVRQRRRPWNTRVIAASAECIATAGFLAYGTTHYTMLCILAAGSLKMAAVLTHHPLNRAQCNETDALGDEARFMRVYN